MAVFNIVPVNQTPPCTIIDMWLTYDDLIGMAIVHYNLKSEENATVISANYTIEGTEYENWDGSRSATVDIIVNYLGITIIPE